MAMSIFHHRAAVEHAYRPHPHAHHIGALAAIIGLLSIPLGQLVVPCLLAMGLGLTAILLSRHPAPGLNARPEGWAAMATGLMGLVLGLAQLLIQRSL